MYKRIMKTCCKCKKRKPVGAFGKARQRKDGLQSQCRECMAVYQRRRKAIRTAMLSAASKRPGPEKAYWVAFEIALRDGKTEEQAHTAGLKAAPTWRYQ